MIAGLAGRSRGKHPLLGLPQQLSRLPRGLQGGQAAGGLDFRRLEDLRVLQALGAAALELAGDSPDLMYLMGDFGRANLSFEELISAPTPERFLEQLERALIKTPGRAGKPH